MTADLYQRPSREEIAARVGAQLPGAGRDNPDDVVTPAPAADAGAAFAAHASVALRRRGWTQAGLAERAGMEKSSVSKLLAGTARRTSLVTAAAIAGALGLSLDAMIRPYDCGTCHGSAPAGFTCNECGTEGERK